MRAPDEVCRVQAEAAAGDGRLQAPGGRGHGQELPGRPGQAAGSRQVSAPARDALLYGEGQINLTFFK